MDSKAPAIVMANGFTGVKEQILPDYAALFAGAGFVTLVFDYRYFGDSQGEPRTLLSCSNSTDKYLYFNYVHSTEQVIIIPESPSFLILPSLTAATLLTIVTIRRRKHT